MCNIMIYNIYLYPIEAILQKPTRDDKLALGSEKSLMFDTVHCDF